MLVGSACGSRTAVEITPGPPPPPECVVNQDCPGFDDHCAPVVCLDSKCQAPPAKDCDDHDPCTIDSCDSDTGACLHPRSTLDLDGDGYYAPLPGKRSTDPDSCGTDCDDTNATAHPGGIEVCDGVDNDCNGIVDDNATLFPVSREIQVSNGDSATTEGLAGNSSGYMGAISNIVGMHAAVTLVPLLASGLPATPPTQFTNAAADSFGGPLVWIGDRFGLTWSDRRDSRGVNDNYEVYFNLANPDGTKRMADVRITNSSGFSLSPNLAWTGNEFVIVWQDDGLTPDGRNTLFAQRVDVDGSLIGQNMRLANDGGDQTPAIAAGQRSVGIVWMRGTPVDQNVMFAPFDQDLNPLKAAVELTGSMMQGTKPIIVYNRGQYVIAWHDQSDDTGALAIYAAVKGELGEDVVPTKTLIRSSGSARYPALLPYGDRLLLVWADDRDN
ncbi:MAG TPA: putative metal-binding motif-containing protein, partial [Polyangiaceae bacterium]